MNILASQSGKYGAKFMRRSDVTPYLRFNIAFTALQAQREKTWGVITTLARTYAISRTCVSLLAASFAVTCHEMFGPSLSPRDYGNIRRPYRYMRSRRLEGRCRL